MTDTPKTLLSRQWSASSLLRGDSYLQEQQEKNKKLTFDDVMKASWLKLFRYHRIPVVFWCHFWHQSLPHILHKVAQQKLQALQGNATPQRKQLFSPSDADRTMFYPPLLRCQWILALQPQHLLVPKRGEDHIRSEGLLHGFTNTSLVVCKYIIYIYICAQFLPRSIPSSWLYNFSVCEYMCMLHQHLSLCIDAFF